MSDLTKEQPKVLLCNCSSTEHSIVFRTDLSEDDECIIEVHLTKLSFIKRLKYAFKYLFGYQCKYGAFEETIVEKQRLKDFVNSL